MTEPVATIALTRAELSLLIQLMDDRILEAQLFGIEEEAPSSVFRRTLLNTLLAARESLRPVVKE